MQWRQSIIETVEGAAVEKETSKEEEEEEWQQQSSSPMMSPSSFSTTNKTSLLVVAHAGYLPACCDTNDGLGMQSTSSTSMIEPLLLSNTKEAEGYLK